MEAWIIEDYKVIFSLEATEAEVNKLYEHPVLEVKDGPLDPEASEESKTREKPEASEESKTLEEPEVSEESKTPKAPEEPKEPEKPKASEERKEPEEPTEPEVANEVERSDPRGSASLPKEAPVKFPSEELLSRPSSPSSVVTEAPPAVEQWRPKPEEVPTKIRFMRALSKPRIATTVRPSEGSEGFCPPNFGIVRALSRPKIVQSVPEPEKSAFTRAASRPRIVHSVTEEDADKSTFKVVRASSRPRLVCKDENRVEATVESPKLVDHGDGEWIAEYDTNEGERGRGRTRNPVEKDRSRSQIRKADSGCVKSVSRREKTPHGARRSISRVRAVTVHPDSEERSAPRGAVAPEVSDVQPAAKRLISKKASVKSTGETKRRDVGLPKDKEERAGPSYASTTPLASNLTKSEEAKIKAERETTRGCRIAKLRGLAAQIHSGENTSDTASASASVSRGTRSSASKWGRRATMESAARANARRRADRDAKKTVGLELAKEGKWPLGLGFEKSWTKEYLYWVMADAKSRPFWGAVGEVAARMLTNEGADPGPLKVRVCRTRWKFYKTYIRGSKGVGQNPNLSREEAMRLAEDALRTCPKDQKYIGTEPPASWSEYDENWEDQNAEEE